MCSRFLQAVWAHGSAGPGVDTPGVGYAHARAALRLPARRGEPLARLLTIDAIPVDDIYPLTGWADNNTQ